MSTRGAIARPRGDGWEGRYHHFDSYPDGLGKDLWDLYHGHFRADLELMQRTLIDDHPAGWSSIDGDWTIEPGYESRGGPRCYCHGQRSEDPVEPMICECHTGIASKSCDPLFIEWAYVLTPTGIMVYDNGPGGGPYVHTYVSLVRWNDLDVNWGEIYKLSGDYDPDEDE